MGADRDEGFEALFRAEYPVVVAAVEVVVRSRALAEELAQEAFCRAYERWRRVARHERPGAWVQLTALRLAYRHERRSVLGARLERGTVARDREDVVVDVDLQQALAGLSSGQRHAVVLHHLVGLPVASVARVMGVRPGTVKTQLHRGRTQLAAALADREEVSDGTR